MKIKRFYSFVVSLFVCANLLAQLPETFNYQAVARNEAGQVLASQTLNILIGIRAGTFDGTIVWEEEHTTNSSNFGLFTLEIGNPAATKTRGTAATFAEVDWAAGAHFLQVQVDYGTGYIDMGTSQFLTVPYAVVAGDVMPGGNLEIIGNAGALDDDPLFEVKRNDGQTVFGVYNEGVRIYVQDDLGKGSKGGFAVGGFDALKGITNEYLRVTPDSVRVYIEDAAKGSKGGFAVGGFDASKGLTNELMRVTRDSTRIYVKNPAGKGSKGGFAVGGFDASKAQPTDFMNLTPQNYFIGHNSGSSITTGLYNSVMGYESGIKITEGESNAFIGYQAGYDNNTGDGNLFLGYQTGYSNFDGNYNSFMGYQSGYNNLGGTNNTFLGSFSGYSNIGGSYNTFVGDSAGYYTTFGVHNTFMGTKVGLNNVGGSSNVFIGDNAGHSNESGSENVFIGRNSGFSNVNTARNVFIGTEAGFNHYEAWDNIFIGTYAGQSHESGAGNVFLGYEAGKLNTSGTRNVLLGNGAGYNEQGSNKLYITNSFSDSTNSLIWGDFVASKLRFNGAVAMNMDPVFGTLSVNSPFGAGGVAVYGPGNGYDYSFLHLKADTSAPNRFYSLSHTVDNSFFLGYVDDVLVYPRLVINKEGNLAFNTQPDLGKTMVLRDEFDIGLLEIRGKGNAFDYASLDLASEGQPLPRAYRLIHTKSNAFLLGYHDGVDIFPRVLADSLGRISLNNWETGTEVLDVNGNARFRGVPSIGGSDLWITADGTLSRGVSDARLKENIEPLANGLEKVLQLQGKTYTWKEDSNEKRDAGLIAQEVENIFPEAVFINPEDGHYGINYSRFPALFVEAFKDQQKIIDQLEVENQDQKAELEVLKQELDAIKILVHSIAQK